MAYRGFKPLFDRVLVQRVVAETKTKVRDLSFLLICYVNWLFQNMISFLNNYDHERNHFQMNAFAENEFGQKPHIYCYFSCWLSCQAGLCAF